MSNEYGDIRISDLSTEKARLLASAVDANKNNDGWIREKDGEWSIFGQKINEAKSKGFDPFDGKDDVAKFKEAMGLTTSSAATNPNTADELAKKAAASAQTQTISKKTPRDEVFEAFKAARGLNEETGKAAKSMKEAYKEVKKEFTDKKKYTKEQRKQYEAALNEIKKGIKTKGGIVKAEVDRIQHRVYNDFKSDKTTNEKLTYDDVVEKLVEYTNGDKRVARALKGRYGTLLQRGFRGVTAKVTEERATIHTLTAAQNSQAIKNKKYTLEELKALLGEENQVLLQEYTDVSSGKKYENALVFAELITKDKDGKYDISKLSEVVENSIGKDLTNNDHDEKIAAESKQIWTNLGGKLNLFSNDKSAETITRLYPNDAKTRTNAMRSLSKSLGYYDDKAIRMLERAVPSAEEFGLVGAGIGAAIGSITIDQDQLVHIPMKGFSADKKAAFIDKIKASNGASSVTETADGISVHQHQLVKLNPLLCSLAGLILGGAVGFVKEALKHSTELKAIYMDISCCDLQNQMVPDGKGGTRNMTAKEQQDFILGKINNDMYATEEEKSELRKLIMLGYVKDSKGQYVLDDNCDPVWDCCTFEREFKKIGGNGNINTIEYQTARWEAEDAMQKILEQQENCDSKACYDIETRVLENNEPDKEDDVKTIDHAALYGWTNLGRMYSCFEDLTDKQAWRAMQVIQAIDPQKVGGKYREDQIIAVVKKAFADNGNGAPNKNYIDNELAKEFDFIDVDKLKSAYHSDYAGTEVTPAQRRIKQGQEGYDQVNIVVAPLALYNANGEKVCDRKAPKIDTRKYNKGDGNAKSKLNVSTHYTQKGSSTKTQEFRGRQGETVTAWFRSETKADSASRQQFPNAERCKKVK